MTKFGWICGMPTPSFPLTKVRIRISRSKSPANPAPASVKKHVSIAGSALEACKRADAIVIATEWKEFKVLEWEEIYQSMNKPAFLFDGRLLVDAQKLTKIGFKVSSPALLFDVNQR
jgi:UDP-N-acetyl-D-mannosaminuronate dehydrogenase